MHQNILLTNTESYDTMKMKSALTTSQGAFQNKKKEVCPMCSLDEEQFIKQKMHNNVTINTDYNIGEKVTHDIYGEGVIITVDKSILTIAFSHPHGIKKIIKGHKSIKKV